MDDSLFDLFQQEHPKEVQYILDHGIPAGHTFLSYLQELSQQTFEQSYKDQQQKDYETAMQQDLLHDTKTRLEADLQDVSLVMTKTDKRALMLKQYDKIAFDRAIEKEAMCILFARLQSEAMPTALYIESARKVLAYVNKE